MCTCICAQAELLRYQSRLHNAFVAARCAEQEYAAAARVHASTAQPREVWIKHTATGHVTAPGYMPLSPAEMGDIVAEMTEVGTGRGGGL